jgi:hypothetical protein
VLAPGDDHLADESAESPARRSPYAKLLIGGLVAALVWWVLPRVPHDQTIVFDLGKNAASVSQLEVHWHALGDAAERTGGDTPEGEDTAPHEDTAEPEDAAEHEGKLVLNFPAPTPERVVRQFRMTDGAYAFRITAFHRDPFRNRTEAVRQVTLDGNSLTLHLDELSP